MILHGIELRAYRLSGGHSSLTAKGLIRNKEQEPAVRVTNMLNHVRTSWAKQIKGKDLDYFGSKS